MTPKFQVNQAVRTHIYGTPTTFVGRVLEVTNDDGVTRYRVGHPQGYEVMRDEGQLQEMPLLEEKVEVYG